MSTSTNPISDLLADRRAQWAQLEPQQQMQRVQYALLDFQNYAVWQRQRQQRTLQEQEHERL